MTRSSADAIRLHVIQSLLAGVKEDEGAQYLTPHIPSLPDVTDAVFEAVLSQIVDDLGIQRVISGDLIVLEEHVGQLQMEAQELRDRLPPPEPSPPELEAQDRERALGEKVVWLLGAGFSKPLGGPLFTELLEPKTQRWVNAWLANKEIAQDKWPKEALSYFREGRRKGMWENAEECLALVEEAARGDALARHVIKETLGAEIAQRVEMASRQLSQFVAVATTYFVDRATHLEQMPETWLPYLEWMKCLTESNDTIVTFNYDRVIDELAKRCCKVVPTHKLHGATPESSELVELISTSSAVATLFVPGPHKLTASLGPLKAAWDQAADALSNADHLIVIGYSFAATDHYARAFILRHCKAKRITIVVGEGRDGDAINEMFTRVVGSAGNSRMLAQQFLAEGTARLNHSRFRC